MPPAFALSQDQTLKFIRSNASIPATPLRIARPSASELRHHSLQYLSQEPKSPPAPATLSHHHPAVSRSQVHQQALRLQTSPQLRQNASHASFPPRLHPAATLRPPQHPHRFKHAAQRPTSRHASLLQITPPPHPSHPAQSARSPRQNSQVNQQ